MLQGQRNSTAGVCISSGIWQGTVDVKGAIVRESCNGGVIGDAGLEVGRVIVITSARAVACAVAVGRMCLVAVARPVVVIPVMGVSVDVCAVESKRADT